MLSDYAKGALASVQQMIQLARKAGVPVLIDPKGTDFERYRGATLLTPNLSEFEAVVGKCKTEEEIVERGMKLIADYEGCRLQPYQCSAGVWTDGIGNTSGVVPGKTITERQAAQPYMRPAIDEHEAEILDAVRATVAAFVESVRA